MRHGYLQFNLVPRSAKPARGEARRVCASSIILGMTLVTVLIWLAAYALIYLHSWSLS